MDIEHRIGTLLEKPIDPARARALHAWVSKTAGDAPRMLSDLTDRLRDRFTEAGLTEWRRLLGTTPATDAHVRTAMERPITVTEVRSAFGDLVRTTKEARFPSVRLSPQDALRIGLTPEMFSRALESGACDTVVDEVLAELEALPRAHAAHVAPRDLCGAPERAQAIMEFVWSYGTAADAEIARLDDSRRASLAGRSAKRMSFAEIRSRLPRTLYHFARGFRRRRTPRLEDLYRATCEHTLAHIARDYMTRVVQSGEPSTAYLNGLGLHHDAPSAFRKELELYLPRPSLGELAHLYHLNLEGKLAARDFFLAARLTQRDLLRLQRERADLFPRAKDVRTRDALPHLTTAHRTAIDEAEIVRAFHREVVLRGKSVGEFCLERGIRQSAWAEIRRNNPALKARQRYSERDIEAIGRRAREIFSGNPLIALNDLVDRINEDETFAPGRVELQRYRQARRMRPDLFPDLRNGWLDPLLPVVEGVIDRSSIPLDDNGIVAKVRAHFAGFTLHHLQRLKKERNLRGLSDRRKRSSSEMNRVLEAIDRILVEDPGLAPPEIGRRLAKIGISILDSDIKRIVHRVRPRSVITGRDLAFERNSYAMRQLLQLVVRVFPPGTPYLDLFSAWDRALMKRGLPSLEPDEHMLTHASYYWDGPDASPKAHAARVAAKILEEYARAARDGDTHDDILSHVLRDYPTLTRYHLGHYLRLWKARPRDYPEVRPFLVQGRLALKKQSGAAPATPRYVGGWSIERAVLGGDRAENAAVAKLSEAIHVPVRTPELDVLLDDLKGSQPLAQTNFLWVSHLLADVVPLGFAFKKAGLSAKQAIVVGTPYGSNDTVRSTLAAMGFDDRRADLDPEAYRRTVIEALEETLERSRTNDHRIVVLDDGGLVADVFHEMLERNPTKYEPFAKRLKIVEQTSGGINLAERHALRVPIIAVARSKSKQAEARYIGKVVAAKIMQALMRTGRRLEGSTAVVGGYGFIGPHIAEELRAVGARVIIVEDNPRVASEAAKRFEVMSKDEAIPIADLVIGATGRVDSPFMSTNDFCAMKDGAIFASASSKRIEADMRGLARRATKRAPFKGDNPLISLPSAEYIVDGKRILVLGDGWPVNFDGGVMSTPPRLIALTDAALFAGVIQICADVSGPGIKPLDRTVDEKILAIHERELGRADPSSIEVYNPDQWRQDILQFAAEVFSPHISRG